MSVHARIFASVQLVSGEIYLNLLQYLNSYMQKSKITASSISSDDAVVKSTLKKFQMLNFFQKKVCNYWCDYPEDVFEKVLKQTFAFLKHRVQIFDQAPLSGTSHCCFFSWLPKDFTFLL